MKILNKVDKDIKNICILNKRTKKKKINNFLMDIVTTVAVCCCRFCC